MPSHSFRSSVDALLLSAFALHCLNIKPDAAINSKPALRFAELGAGSGMAACALALALPEASGLGVEVNSEVVACARSNADKLGLAARLAFVHCAVGDKRDLRKLCGENFDVVLANPPYHDPLRGRCSPSPARSVALHAGQGALAQFCAAAFALLRHHGRFCCIYNPAFLPELMHSLGEHGLGVRRMLPLHTRPSRDAQWVLVEARKNAALDMQLERGFALYAAEQGDMYSPQALAFCPWLAT